MTVKNSTTEPQWPLALLVCASSSKLNELAACKTLAYIFFSALVQGLRPLVLAPQPGKQDVQEKRLELPRQQAVLVLVVDEHRQALPQ